MPTNAEPPPARAGEFFYLDTDDQPADAELHGPILDSLEADATISRQAVERAVESGMSLEDAMELYGNSNR